MAAMAVRLTAVAMRLEAPEREISILSVKVAHVSAVLSYCR